MPRKTTITDENVGQAVEALVREGLDPTLARVRSKLGGGSYTTIHRLLTAVMEKRQTHATQISEVHADLVEIGQRAVATIYAAVQRQAASKIELIETNSWKLIDAANQARAEAGLEIARLEHEAEQAADALAACQRAIQEALTRAERAEATSLAAQAEIQRLERAIIGAQADAQAARESDQEAQKRAARSEDARRAFEAETRKELEHFRKTLTQAEAQLAAANDRIDRLTQGMQNAESEAARLRKERGQLQERIAKAEAGLGAAQSELQRSAKELERAQDAERRARDETAELRGTLAAIEGKGKA